jgi:hypothetical protein
MGVLYDINALVTELSDLLNVDTTENGVKLRYAIMAASETVCNYCNIDEVPEALHITMLRIAADIYKYEMSADASGSAENALSGITNIKLGDTSITAGGDSAASTAFTSGLLKSYKAQLNRYRRVGFE